LGQIPQAQRSTLHPPLLDMRYQLVFGDSCFTMEADIEYRLVVGRSFSPVNLCSETESCSSERHCFEQRPERYLARMAVEVIDAVRSRIVPEYRNAIGCLERKSPRLRVVAARGPSGKVEHFRQGHHRWVETRAAARLLGAPN
jgi:hypothetical protein